ncbi:VOC family protein [Aureimonas sp. AU40]|uniref:VOC family protein n=1 Tax=Aureimonas sp. AU40 TaxID=1637747 RepID=UPI0007810F6F|nr:VOC family protein [Aureimonas sp. AU40]
MTKMIFVNLPVADVERASRFYEAVGARRDERFSQEGVAAMVAFSDTIAFMLLSHARYADFTTKRIVDAKAESEVLICLSETTREGVDATLGKALDAGAKADPTPPQVMGDFMYGRSFEDLDGHVIELMWMDVERAMAAWNGAGAS